MNWRVEAMKLGKDGRAVIYNDWLTLDGIPPEALEYRLGNRSALAWVIDQYRVERDADGEIISDPNPPGDEEAIVRLTGQVVAVSVAQSLRVSLGLRSCARNVQYPTVCNGEIEALKISFNSWNNKYSGS